MSPAALDWKSSRKSRRDRRWAALVMLFGFTLLLVALLVASHHQVAAVNDVLQKRAGAASDGVQSTLKDDGNPSSAGDVSATPSSAVLDAVQTGGPAASPFMSNSEPFPPYEEYAKLVEASSTMPDLIFVPFDVAVKQDSFQGWELDWIANATFNAKQWGKLEEPKIDFVYTWVNGSDEGFQTTKKTYELNSTLNDPDGEWLKTHGTNRYRDWSELKYSIRSVDLNAPFRNRIQVLVNAVDDKKTGKIRKQHPAWLKSDEESGGVVQVLSQEEFFAPNVRGCLPAFNSLTIENQLHNTPSDVDRIFALSDDMLLGKKHQASDLYSPLFGPTMGFKTNSYNTKHVPNEADAKRFGEKPWLIYTSWLLNRRFGFRKRNGQVHFGHSLSRKLASEVEMAFPKPALQAGCSRFRGDLSGFHLYPWYANFHYTMERHREALLWSYLMKRSDVDGDGFLSWSERQKILEDLKEGSSNAEDPSFRTRTFYHVPDILESAGLEPPIVNTDILWTSLDGPVMIKNADCFDYDVNECMAPGFSIPSEEDAQNPFFSSSTILDRVSRQQPECGDCLIKLLLHREKKGLSPMLPLPDTQEADYEVAVKALIRYQYTIVDTDAMFMMITDAEQVESTLIKRFKKKRRMVGQMCLNDDVTTEDEGALEDVKLAITDFYESLFPKASPFER